MRIKREPIAQPKKERRVRSEHIARFGALVGGGMGQVAVEDEIAWLSFGLHL